MSRYPLQRRPKDAPPRVFFPVATFQGPVDVRIEWYAERNKSRDLEGIVYEFLSMFPTVRWIQ